MPKGKRKASMDKSKSKREHAKKKPGMKKTKNQKGSYH